MTGDAIGSSIALCGKCTLGKRNRSTHFLYFILLKPGYNKAMAQEQKERSKPGRVGDAVANFLVALNSEATWTTTVDEITGGIFVVAIAKSTITDLAKGISVWRLPVVGGTLCYLPPNCLMDDGKTLTDDATIAVQKCLPRCNLNHAQNKAAADAVLKTL
jgi:hypothetical protein